MITDYFHIELDGVKYRLAESAEGDHYSDVGQPLRNQTFAVVEGASTSRFQMRPDVKKWVIDDWSGGEGQYRFDPQAANRYWRGNAIDPVERPGSLSPGPAVEECTFSTVTEADYILVKALEPPQPYGVDPGSTTIIFWDPTADAWNASVTNGSATNGGVVAVGDTNHLYYKESSDTSIWQWDGTTFVDWNTDTVTSDDVALGSLGNYLYLLDVANFTVYEIPKTGTPPVASSTLYDLSNQGSKVSNNGYGHMTSTHNRVYVMQLVQGSTIIHEIIPTTSSGTGYGREVARLEGFNGEAITAHLGFVYIIGRDTDDTASATVKRSVMYLQPGADFGTLGVLRPDDDHSSLVTTGDANTMLTAHFVGRTAAHAQPALWGIDAVEGALFNFSRFNYGGGDTVEAKSILQYNGEVFWSSSSGSTDETIHRTLRGTYFPGGAGQFDDSYAMSPIYDFGLSEEKILYSIIVNHEPLPADWEVIVAFELDQDGTWVTAVTSSTTNSTSASAVLSTDTTTYQFNTMRIAVFFNYTGGSSAPTSAPLVTGVETTAGITRPLRQWNLLLELSDEGGQAQNRAWSGATLIDKVNLLIDNAGTVLDFKDGYTNRNPGQYDQYDVVLDAWSVTLDRPGEGVAFVRLTEVL